MDDDTLLALWRGDNCPACQRSLKVYGMLPSFCHDCGVDRGSDGWLWTEIVRRGLVEQAKVRR